MGKTVPFFPSLDGLLRFPLPPFLPPEDGPASASGSASMSAGSSTWSLASSSWSSLEAQALPRTAWSAARKFLLNLLVLIVLLQQQTVWLGLKFFINFTCHRALLLFLQDGGNCVLVLSKEDRIWPLVVSMLLHLHVEGDSEEVDSSTGQA